MCEKCIPCAFFSCLYRLSWVEVNGTKYKLGSVVVLDNDELPKFGVVEDIIVFNTDKYHFVCSLLVTECFSHHFHAFQTSKQHPKKYFICKQTSLYDHSVLAAYPISSQPNFLYVPLKYQLIET